MESKNINSEFLDDFPIDTIKNNYEWTLVSTSKDDMNKRSVFRGINNNDENDFIHAKQFKIFNDENYDSEIR